VVNILALDIATCTGFAHGDGTALPTVGHVRLPSVIDGARGQLFHTFSRWMREKLATVQPDVLIFEAPILPQPFLRNGRIVYPTKLETTLILQGLVAIVELECHGVCTCVQTTVGEVKKQLTGNGKAEKPDMVRAARKMGLRIAVDDEADAAGVWLVGVRYYAKQHLHRFDRMLWGRGATL
jgi:hypothetical protein